MMKEEVGKTYVDLRFTKRPTAGEVFDERMSRVMMVLAAVFVVMMIVLLSVRGVQLILSYPEGERRSDTLYYLPR